MLSALEKAKSAGAKIISVNPLPEAGLERFKNPQTPLGMIRGAALNDLFLQIRIGGDQALFRLLNKMILETDGAVDETFVREHTHGYEEFAAAAREADWEETLAATGLDRGAIEEALAMVLASKRTIVCWAMGLTQHKHSVPTIREVVNFLLLRGNIGRPGAGVCPVRGHSNVQGDRTMGIFERPAPAFLDALDAEFGITSPRHHGYDVVRSIQALRDGDAKVFFAMGGNFVAATPDTDVTEAAMRRARLTVHVSTKVNRSHAVTGTRALILPTLGRTDKDVQASGKQFVTVEDSMSMVHASRGNLTPASPHLLSEPAIVARLARAVLGPASRTPWEEFEKDYATIRDRISRVVPGFEDFNARVAHPGGFTLPHAPRDERRFPTATGKANFTAAPVEYPELPEGRLLLQTLRSTTSTTPPSTASTTATAASRAAAGSSWSTPTTPGPSAWPTGRTPTSSVNGRTGWSAAPPASASCTTRPPGAAPPPTTRRPMCWSPSVPPPTPATPRPASPSSSASRTPPHDRPA